MRRLQVMGLKWLIMIVIAFKPNMVRTYIMMAKVTDAHGIFTLNDCETEILLDEFLLVVLNILHLILLFSPHSIRALMTHI